MYLILCERNFDGKEPRGPTADERQMHHADRGYVGSFIEIKGVRK